MFRLFGILLIAWLTHSHAYSATTKSFPLDYWPELGDYTLNIYIDGQYNNPYGVSIDTASANLNLVGSPFFCPDCDPVEAYKPYQLSEDARPLNLTFSMKYSLGGGVLEAFQSSISLSPRLTIPNFRFAVYKKGDNISNLLGLAYNTIAAPKHNPTPTLIDKLKYHEFSLLLCDERARSKLILGPPEHVNHLPHYMIPIVKKTFYNIPHYGISDKSGIPLTHFSKGEVAILDSATTGRIVYPQKELNQLLAYLKHVVKAHHTQLPPVFWSGKTCIPNEMIKKAAFPTLYFHFLDANHQIIRLPLPPERYITSGGCGSGYSKLAFISFKDHQFHPHTKHHKRDVPTPIILGTPFLEHYFTRFQQHNPAQVTFYLNDHLCVEKK